MRILVALVASAVFAAAPQTPPVEAQLLDHSEYRCKNCFFGSSRYYYCFAAGDKILIGYQKTPELNWKDHSSNLLAKVRKKWEPWAAEGQTVPLRYDDKTIRVTRSDGKEVKLKQDYTRDAFLTNSQCKAAVKPAN
jgi:hypothetical protein